MDLRIVNKSTHPLPEYKTAGSAGFDLRAFLPNGSVVLKPMERMIVPTGLYMEIPVGLEGQVRSRSGCAVKQGLTVINAPGTIDSDYRGEVGISIINLSTEDQEIKDGERIAQMVITAYSFMSFVEVQSVEELSQTERGAGGFGHTGK